MTWDELRSILERGDEKACLKLLEKANEKQRQAVAKPVVEWFKKINKSGMVEEKPGHWRQNPLLPAAKIALFGCASFGQIKGSGRWFPNEAYEVLLARRPPWMNEWADLILQLSPANHSLVRQLVRDGLCRRPTSDNYLLGLLTFHDGTFGRFSDVRQGILGDEDVLNEDLWRLFELEGNGEFSLAARDKYSHKPEGRWCDSLVALANEGKLPRGRLLDASLDALERDFAQFRAGWFSRFHEALKPTLDERAVRTKRYLGLLGSRIPPTVSFGLKAIKELKKAKRLAPELIVEHIGPALFARAKGTVQAGLELLSRAVTASPKECRAGVQLAATALAHESAEVQKAALDLILKHGDSSDKELVSILSEKLNQVAPSQKPRLSEWLGALAISNKKDETGAEDLDLKSFLKRARSIDRDFARLAGVDVAMEIVNQGGGPIPALKIDDIEIPRLDPEKKISPIENLDELIEAFAATLENPGDLDEVERVLDGVSRLCDQRPSDFATHTGPLRKRALTLMKRAGGTQPFSGGGYPHDLYGLAVSWITGEAISPKVLHGRKDEHGGMTYEYPASWDNWKPQFYRREARQTIEDFVSARLWSISERVASGKARTLLSAPTHSGGWIDPRSLVERVSLCQKLKVDLEIFDQVQCLLRLAPDHRVDALRKCKKFTGEFAEALRYSLGGEAKEIGPTAALWIAAARARSPFEDDPRIEARHPEIGPDAGIAARYRHSVTVKKSTYEKKTYTHHWIKVDHEPRMEKMVPNELPTVLLHGQIFNPKRLEWPLARESMFAAGAYHIGINLDWWEAAWENRLYLEPLLDPDVPLKHMALLLLALGLAAKEPGEHGLAVDALIVAIDDGRVAGDNLGNILASLLPTGLVLAKRYAKTLGEAAQISELHAHVVIGAIVGALKGLRAPKQLDSSKKTDSPQVPRDLHSLLELLRELLTASGETMADPEAKECLIGVKASGQTGAVIKCLLALPEIPSKERRLAAALRALAGRIERAERWMKWRNANNA
jgi:hypothetical protein